MKTINAWLASCSAKMVVQSEAVKTRLQEKKGDIPINTLGGILMAVFGVVLTLAALKKFMPGIFNTMFGSLTTKLSELWTSASTDPTFP